MVERLRCAEERMGSDQRQETSGLYFLRRSETTQATNAPTEAATVPPTSCTTGHIDAPRPFGGA